MLEIVKAFHNQKIAKVNGFNYIVNPLLDHDPETKYELVDDTIKELSKLTDFSKINKIVGEEDRGGYLAGIMAYVHKKSLGMVKWNPIDLEGQIGVNFRNAYTEGKMYLYGVKENDKIVLVEDLVDSGGTIIAMIELLRKAKVEIVDLICLAEKAEIGGIERIKRETGLDVKYILKFLCTGQRSKVTDINGVKVELGEEVTEESLNLALTR